ncbi:MAG: tetratricopeptide repeat protein, partial [Cyanobacteria bacterium J06639_1]
EAKPLISEAIYLAETEVQSDSNSNTLHQRGLAYSIAGQYAKAIADYTSVLEIDPCHATAWYSLACCYAEQGDLDLSIDALSWAVALEPVSLSEEARQDKNFAWLRETLAFRELVPQQG